MKNIFPDESELAITYLQEIISGSNLIERVTKGAPYSDIVGLNVYFSRKVYANHPHCSSQGFDLGYTQRNSSNLLARLFLTGNFDNNGAMEEVLPEIHRLLQYAANNSPALIQLFPQASKLNPFEKVPSSDGLFERIPRSDGLYRTNVPKYIISMIDFTKKIVD